MSVTWRSADQPQLPPVTAAGWCLVALRGVLLAAVIGSGLLLMLVLRLIERPLSGASRPVTPHLTRIVCRLSLLIMGIGYVRRGVPMRGTGACVANHASWLDILALNVSQPVYFVAKADVAGWPGIGLLARVTGTLFINRTAREAQAQQRVFEARLAAGHRLLFFPEGTSTDGQRVLPFKPTLFAALFAPELAGRAMVQPVSVLYRVPTGADPRFYGWWGDMDFGPHALATLARWRQGRVEVTLHPPRRIADFADRKALAAACEAAVREEFSVAERS